MRIFGIPIKFSFSAWFLVAFVGWYGFVNLSIFGVEGTVHLASGVTLIVVGLIFSIVFHELTHALVARRYGIPTEQIAIWGLGGTAYIKGKFTKPGEMFWVSVMGPVSSLVLGGILYFAVWIGDLLSLRSGAPGIYWGLIYLTIANVVLAIFNMIPALPLDGGGVLQAIVWKINGNQNKAGIFAAYMGMLLAIVGGLYAIIFLRDFFLALIAGFVYLTASAERSHYKQALLEGEESRED